MNYSGLIALIRCCFFTKSGLLKLINGDPISFAIMKRDNVELMLQTRRLGGVPGKNGCYIKLTGVEALYSEYQKKGVTIVHPLRTEEYGMKEFMIADLDGNKINFGE